MDNGLVLVDLETLEFYNVVLILVVVDNGLVQDYDCGIEDNWLVLILVVVDNGLVHALTSRKI